MPAVTYYSTFNEWLERNPNVPWNQAFETFYLLQYVAALKFRPGPKFDHIREHARHILEHIQERKARLGSST